MANEDQHDLPTLVSSLQAATVEWSISSTKLTNASMASGGVGGRGNYLRYMLVLQEIEDLLAVRRSEPHASFVEWCTSLLPSRVSSRLVSLLIDHILQGILPYVVQQRCLRVVDMFLSWATCCNRIGIDTNVAPYKTSTTSLPVLIPSHEVSKWIGQVWKEVTTLSRDNAGTSSPNAVGALCGALQLLPVLLHWNEGVSPLPPFQRWQLPHTLRTHSLEASIAAFRVLPTLLLYQSSPQAAQASAIDLTDYVKRGCAKASDLSVRIAAAASLRGLLEAGLRIPSPAVAYALVDTLLELCDDASLYDIPDEELHDAGVAMGYLLAFYQSDFTMETLADISHAVASAAAGVKASGDERIGHRGTSGTARGASAAGPHKGGSGGVRWRFFGGADAMEGSRVVQRSFNDRMTRLAQRSLATALATLCYRCATPATMAEAIRCCFVLLVPVATDPRAYMPRLLADAIVEWALLLPSNSHRVVLADALRGYTQPTGEDKAVVRTAMVALKGVMRTLSSSHAIGFIVAEDVLSALHAMPSLLHVGVEVLGAVARTNVLYARYLKHKCAMVDSASVANQLSFQLHIRALLDAVATTSPKSLLPAPLVSPLPEAFNDDDRVALIHVCIRLLLRLSRGDPPRIVQDIHYRQAELIFRLTQLLYHLLRHSPLEVLAAARSELQPCTLGFMNLLVSSPAPTIAYYKAITAACAMLQSAPVVSDTERMLAVGLLEARLAPQNTETNQDSGATSAVTAAAAEGYFAVARGSLYELIAGAPWLTCRDDGSLRWLASQALKDVAAACAKGVPVLRFADVYDPEVAKAAQVMRLLCSDLLPRPDTETLVGMSSIGVETSQPLGECGGHAVRLLRWTLRHFMKRGDWSVCVTLFSALYRDLYEVHGRLGQNATVGSAAGNGRRAKQAQDMALWNILCVASEFLQEVASGDEEAAAAALRQNVRWCEEEKRWQALAGELISVSTGGSTEVRLLAAKVLAWSLICVGQVDVYTSQAVSAVGRGCSGTTIEEADAFGALTVLLEMHSCAGEPPSTKVERQRSSYPTLPLATSLLAAAWKQLKGSATAITATPTYGPLLVLLSLRMACVYPAEVEAALSESLTALLLSPMTAANHDWWSPELSFGMLTAVLRLWAAFPDAKAGGCPLRRGTALLLLHESLTGALVCPYATAPAATAALRAVHAYTVQQSEQVKETSRTEAQLQGCRLWHLSLLQCLDHVCLSTPSVRPAPPGALSTIMGAKSMMRWRHVHDDGFSRRLALLWRTAILGAQEEEAKTIRCEAAVGTHTHLRFLDIAILIDGATTVSTRQHWVALAGALGTTSFPRSITTAEGLPSSGRMRSPLCLPLVAYVNDLGSVLQARPPDVHVNSGKRDADMFPAEEETSGMGSPPGGGNGAGGNSDSAEDYAEEFGDESVGGILSGDGVEAGESETVSRGNGDVDASNGDSRACGNGNSTASLTFDIAAKEGAMWLLYGVLHSLTFTHLNEVGCNEGDKTCEEQMRGVLLRIVVTAAQLVEVYPEIQMATIAVLHEVLRQWGSTVYQQGEACCVPVLLPWKTQVVVGLTTVLQHGLFSLENCTALAVQYTRCDLADASSCRRILRSLLLLLHACHRLEERGRSFLLTSGVSAGHVIVALAKAVQSSVMVSASAAGRDTVRSAPMMGCSDSFDPTEHVQRAILRELASPASQAALTQLCARFIMTASLANGYVPSTNTAGMGWVSEQDADGDAAAASASSFYRSRLSVNAGDVLGTLTTIVQASATVGLGPALRHATGCLAALALCTFPLPIPTCDSEESSLDDVLQYVVIVGTQCTAAHQRVLAEQSLAMLRTLLDNGLLSIARLSASQGIVVRNLLRLLSLAPVAREAAVELWGCLVPWVTSQQPHAAWVPEAAASLLCVGLMASLEIDQVQPLLANISVDALTEHLSREVASRLCIVVSAYLHEGGEKRVKTMALMGPTGLFLAEQGASLSAESASGAVCTDPSTWQTLLQLLSDCRDPLGSITSMRGESLVHPSPPSPVPAALHACVSHHHQRQAEVLLAVLASLGLSPDAAATEEAAKLIRKCGDLLCELLRSISGNATDCSANSLYPALLYIVTVLSTRLSLAFAGALRNYGRYLVRTVAPTSGPALRDAIQRLGPAKAAQLRGFMEESCA